MTTLQKSNKRIIRHRRVRSKIRGTDKRPRLSVFRSNRYIFAQLIDDTTGRTLVSVADKGISNKKESLKKTERARQAGKDLAKKALAKKIESVVFDRGGFDYHGRVKAFAEGSREGGLKF